MNFLIKYNTFIILILFSLLTSCSKDSNENISSLKEAKAVFPMEEGNPFEVVGKYHNAMLDIVISDYFYTNTDMDSIVFYNTQKESIIDNSDSVWNNLECQFVFTMDMPTLIGGIIDSVNEFDDIESSLSDEQLIYYNEIKSVINKNIKNTPNKMFAEMSVVESEILESGMQDEQAATMLIAASIAKYSFTYWYNQYNMGNQSLWMQIYNTGAKQEEGGWFASMGRIVDADIEGGIGGALLGGAVGATGGSVIPGAGTLTGGIAGVVVGGCSGSVTGSAVRGVFELFGH